MWKGNKRTSFFTRLNRKHVERQHTQAELSQQLIWKIFNSRKITDLLRKGYLKLRKDVLDPLYIGMILKHLRSRYFSWLASKAKFGLVLMTANSSGNQLWLVNVRLAASLSVEASIYVPVHSIEAVVAEVYIISTKLENQRSCTLATFMHFSAAWICQYFPSQMRISLIFGLNEISIFGMPPNFLGTKRLQCQDRCNVCDICRKTFSKPSNLHHQRVSIISVKKLGRMFCRCPINFCQIELLRGWKWV